MPAIIKDVPIIIRIISIILPKQPSIASNPTTAQKQNPTIISETPSGTPKIIQQATRKIIANINLIHNNLYLYLRHIG